MSRKRLRGPLDPLFRELREQVAGRVDAFAKLVGVSRQTVNRWQQGGAISPYNKLKINMLFISRGLDAPFDEKHE